MACRLAENGPLMSLQRHLGLPPKCHSLREDCVHGHPKRSGMYAMGIPGAVIGYCQALLNYAGNPREHTVSLTTVLEKIGAPWAMSHELYWSYRKDERVSDYIESALSPLLGQGRIPILITAMDPAKDGAVFDSILDTDLSIFPGETALVRMVLKSDASIEAAERHIKRILAKCRATRTMPKWWPLLQGDLSAVQWRKLKNALGTDWEYCNVAVNPWTCDVVFEHALDQVTVAQIVVGLKEGIREDGRIEIPPGMFLTGAAECDSYSIPVYARKLAKLSVVPTLIVLGPSQPEWTADQNMARLQRLIPFLRNVCEHLWEGLPKKSRDKVWRLSA